MSLQTRGKHRTGQHKPTSDVLLTTGGTQRIGCLR